MLKRTIHRIAAALSLLALSTFQTSGQEAAAYPTQPIRIIVPFAPGGAPDIVARLVAQHASAGLGRQVYVENITGAGGNIGMQAGARAAPDGYTVLLCTLGCATNPALLPNLGWDPRTDIVPIMMGGIVPNVLVVNSENPVNSTGAFVERAKAKPGGITMASSGLGSASHLAGEMFKAMTGTDIVHVPYRGSTAALPDIVAGRVDSMIVSLPEALSLIQSGQLKALGVSSTKRVASLPDVPTIEEAGVSGYAVSAWSAFFAPAATPPSVISRLNAEFNKAIKSPEVSTRLADLSIQPGGGPPQAAGDFLQSETSAWAKLIQERGLKAQ